MTRPSDGRRGGGERDPTCCHPLSSVIRRCTLPSPVVSSCRSSTPVTTRCHPLSPAVTRRQPLSSVVRLVTRRRWHVLRVVLGASFPGSFASLAKQTWWPAAFRASCLPCLAELKTPNRHGCGMRGLQLGSCAERRGGAASSRPCLQWTCAAPFLTAAGTGQTGTHIYMTSFYK